MMEPEDSMSLRKIYVSFARVERNWTVFDRSSNVIWTLFTWTILDVISRNDQPRTSSDGDELLCRDVNSSKKWRKQSFSNMANMAMNWYLSGAAGTEVLSSWCVNCGGVFVCVCVSWTILAAFHRMCCGMEICYGSDLHSRGRSFHTPSTDWTDWISLIALWP